MMQQEGLCGARQEGQPKQGRNEHRTSNIERISAVGWTALPSLRFLLFQFPFALSAAFCFISSPRFGTQHQTQFAPAVSQFFCLSCFCLPALWSTAGVAT